MIKHLLTFSGLISSFLFLNISVGYPSSHKLSSEIVLDRASFSLTSSQFTNDDIVEKSQDVNDTDNVSLVKKITKIDDIPNSQDGEDYRVIIENAIADNLNQQSIGEVTEKIALNLLGKSYHSNLLDQFSSQEKLFISLNKFDCVLFVETVLALAKGITTQDYNYSTFTSNVTDYRYRDGNLDNYCSRLHYFSDWIADNQKRGNVENITTALTGVNLDKKLNFMSTNRSKYPKLADENNYQCIVEVENNLTQLDLNYIPTNKIKNIYSQLQSGDIIAIATSISGLDVTHTGLVYRQGNKISLIHASPAGKVTIASDLQTYTSRVRHAIGIIVVRPH